MCEYANNRLRHVRRWLLLAFLTLPVLANNAAAHPHVFVTVETEVLYNADKAIIGFRHKWSFDELYTSMATQSLDVDGDGKYSAEELQSLLELNVSSLKEFEYFTFPSLAGKILDREEPKDYRMEYKDEILTLYLTVPLKEPVPFAKTSAFSLVISDPSFYVDFAFAETNPVRLAAAPAGCKAIIKDPRPDPKEVARLQALGNDYFADPNVASSIAALYAKSVKIACTKPEA